jgi:hypothetical protein
MAGGGFGEAALMSAVIGGGVSAVKGEDPLKGALLGGLMGGATGGIGNLLSPAAAATANATMPSALLGVGAETAAANSLGLGGGALENMLAGDLSGAALSTAVPAEVTNAALGAQNLVNNAGPGVQLAGNLTPEVAQQVAAENIIPPQLQAQQDQLVNAASQIPRGYGTPTSSGGLPDIMNKLGSLSTPEKLLYGGTAALAAPAVMSMFKGKKEDGGEEEYDGPLKKFKYDPSRYTPLEVTPPTPYQPVYKDYRNYASGGIASLGKYSDYARGGRMLKGPGDGMSDDIPATIAGNQPARLANEEFVIPADVVSHLGNGSSEAGAKQLYKMMDRVRHARTGKKKQGKQINPEKYLA